MPIGFLTAAERDRLNRFPTQIPDEDLRASSSYQTRITRRSTTSTRTIPALALPSNSVRYAISGLSPITSTRCHGR
jgi:hypothetical protein